jgi:hypothetical protein
MDCDTAAAAAAYGPSSSLPIVAGGPEDNTRRSDSLPVDGRGGSLPSNAGGGRASMSSQASQSVLTASGGLPLPPKLPPATLASIASILTPDSTSASPGSNHKAKKSEKTPEQLLKAKVRSCII